MKKIIFRKVNRAPKKEKWVSSWPTTAQGIVYVFAWHLRKLQITIDAAAAKMQTTAERLRDFAKYPMKLDLFTICRMEAIIKRDLIVAPSLPNGYFKTNLNERIHDVDNYLYCTSRNRILGSPKPDIPKFLAFWQTILERRASKRKEIDQSL